MVHIWISNVRKWILKGKNVTNARHCHFFWMYVTSCQTALECLAGYLDFKCPEMDKHKWFCRKAVLSSTLVCSYFNQKSRILRNMASSCTCSHFKQNTSFAFSVATDFMANHSMPSGPRHFSAVRPAGQAWVSINFWKLEIQICGFHIWDFCKSFTFDWNRCILV